MPEPRPSASIYRTQNGLQAVSFRRDEEFLGAGNDGVNCFDRGGEEILAELLLLLWSVGQRRLDCCEQVRPIEWLVQKSDGPFVEGPLSNLGAIVGRY